MVACIIQTIKIHVQQSLYIDHVTYIQRICVIIRYDHLREDGIFKIQIQIEIR